MILFQHFLSPIFFCCLAAAFSTRPVVPLQSSQFRRISSFTALFAQEEATFGMGCFWKPSEELLKVPGVINTVVGYTGKQSLEAPSYESVCFSREWVEGVRVEYDNSIISYEQLLDAFFQYQEPAFGGSRQYASFIFTHSQQQEKIAQAWSQRNTETIRKDGVPARLTQIESLQSFYQAEQYHQRYWQKMRPRIVAMVGLLSISSGAIDSFVPLEYASSLHTATSSLGLAGCAYVLLERKIDTNVVRLS